MIDEKTAAALIHNSNLIEREDCRLTDVLTALNSVPEDRDDLRNLMPSVMSHVEALWYVQEHCYRIPDVDDVKKLHGILMNGMGLWPKHLGGFRDCRVTVGGHIPPASEHLDRYMEQWSKLWPLDGKQSILDAAWKRHFEFEWIHPFIDGNGRTGRLLMAWDCLLHRIGIPIILYDNRDKYYEALALYESTRSSDMSNFWGL
jgi:Fic family protein